MGPTHPWWSFVGACVARRREASWQGKGHKAKITPFGKKKEKTFLEHLFKRGKIGSTFKFKLGGLIKGNFGSTITWRKRRDLWRCT